MKCMPLCLVTNPVLEIRTAWNVLKQFKGSPQLAVRVVFETPKHAGTRGPQHRAGAGTTDCNRVQVSRCL